MEKAVVILGPTGVGKSEFAIKLAKILDGEIISADSVQIYRGFDIGSGKVTEKEMQNVKHHCIDILDPSEEYSVFQFVEETKKLVKEICERGKVPIIVGGTALYVKALKEGYDFGGSGKVSELREKLWQMEEEELRKMLKKLDAKRESQILPHDKKKLIRAIEIASSGIKASTKPTELELKIVALTMEREKLYARINARVDSMMERGLVEEVEGLVKSGHSHCMAMQAIGYKETLQFFEGKITKEECSELIKRHSRNYAKRQMTFLRGMGAEFFTPEEFGKMETEIREFLGRKE